MGRSVHEHHVSLSKEQADELALLAVCDESGVDVETLRTALKRLEEICPPLAKRRARGEVKPAEMARLALDLPAVTNGMLGIKRLLPGANAAELCARQTSLFAKSGVDNAVAVVNALRAGLEGAGLDPSACDELIAAVPAVLVIDADDGGTIAGIVARAGALRDALPSANLAELCGKRPEFLVTKDRGEYRLTYESEPRVGHAAGMPVGEKRGDEKSAPGDGDGDGDPAARWPESWYVYRSARQMRERMPSDCDVDRLLTDFPNILAMDVPALFEDLRQVFPGKAPADVLRRNPSISFQVSSFPLVPFLPSLARPLSVYFVSRARFAFLDRLRRAHPRIAFSPVSRSSRRTRRTRGLCDREMK
jgi:hypothetical protein